MHGRPGGAHRESRRPIAGLHSPPPVQTDETDILRTVLPSPVRPWVAQPRGQDHRSPARVPRRPRQPSSGCIIPSSTLSSPQSRVGLQLLEICKQALPSSLLTPSPGRGNLRRRGAAEALKARTAQKTLKAAARPAPAGLRRRHPASATASFPGY